MRLRSCFFLAINLLILVSGCPVWANSLVDVRLIAHRGCTADHPENSLGAIQAAIDLGIQGTEIDLRTTADGHIVLMHDERLDRTTTGAGPVRETSLADIQKLKLKTPAGVTEETVPTLAEILDLIRQHHGFELILDLKDVDWTRIAGVIDRSGLAERVWFYIPDPQHVDACRKIKAVNPRLRLSVGLADWWKIEGVPTFVIKALGAGALFAPEWEFPRFGFTEAHEAGAEVQVYLWGEQDLVQRARSAAERGADVISVDHPQVLAPLTGGQ